MGDERRRATRQVMFLPAHVEHDAQTETSMIADVSTSGARLLMCRPELRARDAVHLELCLDVEGTISRQADGRVVRVEALPDERVSVWTHEVAVVFDGAPALTDAELSSMQERLTALRRER
jgi:hypothetical protein